MGLQRAAKRTCMVVQKDAVRLAAAGCPTTWRHDARAIGARVATVVAAVAYLARERRRALGDHDANRVADAPARRGRAVHGDLVAARRVQAHVGHAGRDVLIVRVREARDLEDAGRVDAHGRVAPAVLVGGELPAVALVVGGVGDLPRRTWGASCTLWETYVRRAVLSALGFILLAWSVRFAPTVASIPGWIVYTRH